MAKVRIKGPGPDELGVECGKLEAEVEIIRLEFLPNYFDYNLDKKRRGSGS